MGMKQYVLAAQAKLVTNNEDIPLLWRFILFAAHRQNVRSVNEGMNIWLLSFGHVLGQVFTLEADVDRVLCTGLLFKELVNIKKQHLFTVHK